MHSIVMSFVAELDTEYRPCEVKSSLQNSKNNFRMGNSRMKANKERKTVNTD